MSKFLDGTGLTDILTKIKNAFVAKSDTTAVTGVSVDSTPTANSTNLVESGGVKAYVDNAVAPEVFWATYGTTTVAQIDAAVTAGYAVMCRYSGKDYALVYYEYTGSFIYFGALFSTNAAWLRVQRSNNNWAAGLQGLEPASNKVTSLSSSSTDSKYPSAKCVYDELQGKQGVIDSTHKLDYSLIDNQPTIPELTDYTDAELQTAIDTAFAGL